MAISGPSVEPLPLVPDYGGECLTGVMPAVLAGPGHRPAWFPPEAADAAQVVVLVLDGLGWEQLASRSAVAPTMASMGGGPICSVVPTTTATALTSLTFGSAPAEHGMVGYRFVVPGPTGDEVLNVLGWRTASGDARQSFPPELALRGQAFDGCPVPVVSKSEFVGTGFSLAHQTGSRSFGWSMPSSIAVEVRRLLAAGEAVIYVYYEGVDKVAHLTGLGEHYDAELRTTDRMVGDLIALLPPGAALLITADHGQVEVGERTVPLDDDLVGHTAAISGEARFRWLHARPGQSERLAELCRRRYAGESWVRTIDEVVDQGWFGGPLRAELLARLGDVVLVPFAPIGYVDPADRGDVKLICRHGSLTSAEVLVPLIAAAGG